MRAIAFAFHDVVENGGSGQSGFPGRLAARYKLTWGDFANHLSAIAGASSVVPGGVSEISACHDRTLLFLTFDDGGASGMAVGEVLAQRGWCAQFLIPVDYIAQHGFMRADEIRALHEMGHEIGSHSCSHPDRMRELTDAHLLQEWSRSRAVLEEILGAPVVFASVPGGSYSRRVARAAASAGIRVLFTSEPTRASRDVDGCIVLGRYRIVRTTTEKTSAGLACGAPLPRLRQFAAWNTKKAVKAVAGDAYLRARRHLS